MNETWSVHVCVCVRAHSHSKHVCVFWGRGKFCGKAYAEWKPVVNTFGTVSKYCSRRFLNPDCKFKSPRKLKNTDAEAL